MKIKSQKGFTLVEVIVVAVIVAVLAAIAIPLYLGYVKSTSNDVAKNAGGSAASFCGACVNSTLVPSVSGDGKTLVCTGNDATMLIPEGVTMVINGNKVTATSTKGGASHEFTFNTAP